MSEVLDRIVTTREDAHATALDAYRVAQAVLANGKKARILTEQYDDDRTLRQNRFYWGACLREISEQAQINGQRYTIDAWHELFRRQFLGYEIEKVHVAGRKKPVINRRLKSTTKLKVKVFGEYLDKIQAFGAADLGVEFSVHRWQDYQG